MRRLKFAVQLLIAILPSCLKLPIYRSVFGYRIGRGVRIGLTPIIGVDQLQIGNGTRIGSLNIIYRVDQVVIGERVKIGYFNCFRGGHLIWIGDYCSILRLNTFNAIIDGEFISFIEPALEIGAGSVVTTGHWLDFSAGIWIGDHVIIGGRNSSLWTHSRQIGKPVAVGTHTYLGSEVRLAPGFECCAFLRGCTGVGSRRTIRHCPIVDRREPGQGYSQAERARPFFGHAQDTTRHPRCIRDGILAGRFAVTGMP